MGTETTGALSFQTQNRPPQPADMPLRQVTAQELDKRIQARQQQPLALWDGKVRISVAGLQDKMLVLVQNDQMHLAEHSFASIHLLKPEPLNPATPFMVANQHYCLMLARRLGLEAADAAIGRLSTPYLLVPRFDRVPRRQRVERLHVLDGCQALDLPVSHKYERNLGQGRDVRHVRDGASFEGLFGLRRFLSQPALQTRALTRWAILSLLIGNSDAHGKNISFRVLPSGLTVAPFYDLVSVVQYDAGHLDHELAMAYGDEFELEKIAAFDLAAFCQRCGLQRAYFARELSNLSRAAARAAPQLVNSDVYTSEERDFVANIAGFVVRQAGRLLELARTLPDVDRRIL